MEKSCKQVMVSVVITVLVVVSCLASASRAHICKHKVQYWSNLLEKCVDCQQCKDGHIVVAPCEIFKDTVCLPFQKFLKINDNHHHRHKHHNHHHHRVTNGEDTSIKSNVDATEEDVKMARFQASLDAPFDRTETLVWDWQAVVMTLAVFACILFFIVITLYSFHQARQWKRLKETFEADADVEELAAKLCLMAAASSNEKRLTDGDVQEGNCNNRCVYLEQLLNVRKDDKLGTKHKGNVYIEESI